MIQTHFVFVDFVDRSFQSWVKLANRGEGQAPEVGSTLIETFERTVMLKAKITSLFVLTVLMLSSLGSLCQAQTTPFLSDGEHAVE